MSKETKKLFIVGCIALAGLAACIVGWQLLRKNPSRIQIMPNVSLGEGISSNNSGAEQRNNIEAVYGQTYTLQAEEPTTLVFPDVSIEYYGAMFSERDSSLYCLIDVSTNKTSFTEDIKDCKSSEAQPTKLVVDGKNYLIKLSPKSDSSEPDVEFTIFRL